MELKNYEENINIIEEVEIGSIGEELEIEPGDILLSINGQKVNDIIEYKYLITDDYIEMEIQKPDGEIWELEIEKGFDEGLGISFTNPLIDKAKNCRNKCIFCFIDQLPKGMRKTLYFKDDDSRLSFLQGNFITLTNLSDDEIDRIIKYRISPINISVHTTNPELRVKMLGNKNAGRVFEILKKFADARLSMNAQIVAVPCVNDSDELERTLNDLSSLYPSIESVAIVPVGVTKFRENLFELDIYNKDTAGKMVELVERIQKENEARLGTKFSFISDEFYLVAGREIPNEDYYEGYPQLENGVGLVRSFQDEIEKAVERLEYDESVSGKYTIATGKLAANHMQMFAKMVQSKYPNVEIDVVMIKNNFFGENITVAGLITGTDLYEQLNDRDLGNAVFIPKAMLKSDEDVFLDDMTLEELTEKLGTEVIAEEVDGQKFVNLFSKKQ